MLAMEERKRRLVLLLGLYMFLYMLVKHVVAIQALILQGEWEKFAILSVVYESMRCRERSIWSQERMYGFVDRLLLGSWTEKEFRKRTRVKYVTFRFLCERLGPYLQKEDTRFRVTVPVQERIAMSLHRLGNGDGLQSIGDLYGVHKSTLSIIVREFCRAVRKHLQPIFVQTPSESQFRVLASLFEKLHGIPYIIGAIDGSHIPVLAPVIGGEDYYCRKSFHSAILQGIVGPDCMFWDYEFGWAGSLHDWAVFQVSNIGRKCIEGKLQPYKLIGDAAYPVRPWMYCPFKGGKTTLSGKEANWNFIQSSTRMCVERAFGILKGRWRMIMKRSEIPLKNMPDIVATCIVLHNLCIVNNEGIEEDWIVEAESKLARRMIEGEIREGSELRGERAGIAEVRRRILANEDVPIADEVNDEETEIFLLKENEKATDLLREATAMHKTLAESLWQYKLRIVETDSDSDIDMTE